MRITKTASLTVQIKFHDKDELDLFCSLLNFTPVTDTLATINPRVSFLFEQVDLLGNIHKFIKPLSREIVKHPYITSHVISE